MMMKFLLPAGCVLLLAQGAYAKDDTLELLAQKGVITAEEYAKIKEANKDTGVVSLKDGFKVQSHDGKNAVQLGTLLQLDVAGFQGDSTDTGGGSELRRARLYINGNVGKLWDFKTEVELAGTVVITDAYAAYHGFKPLSLTVGHFKSPFSLEASMADKNLTFMERSLSSSFLSARAPGLMLSSNGDNWTASFAVLGEQLSTATTDDEGGGASTRVTFSPWFASGEVLHLGASAHWRKPSQLNAKDETMSFKSKPEANQFVFNDAKGASVTQLVNTGDIAGGVEDYQLASLELAGELGPVVWQNEYSQARVNRDTKANVTFEGWYSQLAYTLTGEARAYRGDKGVFEGIKPAKNYGAWEVAARYSVLDLSDADVKGGKENNLGVALNWYINSVARLGLNYIKVLEVKGGKSDGNEPSAVQLRAQLAY